MMHMVADAVDDPVPLFFWDPPEFVVASTLIGLGVLFNPFIGFLGAFVVLSQAPKLKRGNKKGAVQHWLWIAGLPIESAFKNRVPPSWLKDFIE